jgi:membrane-associated phospholipid phosphatase
MNILIKILADYTLVLIILLTGYSLLFQVKNKIQVYPKVIMSGLTSLLIAKLVSVIYQPDIARPFMLNNSSAGASYINNPGFPSDHALLATFLASMVWLGAKNKKLAIFLVFLDVVMSISRVIAGVHSPVDIVGGIVFGLFGLVWYIDISAQKR